MKNLPRINHGKLIILAIWVGLLGTLSTLGWELPVQQTVQPLLPGCEKSLHRDELPDDCKIDIYKDGAVNPQAVGIGDLIVSVIWGASYNDGRVAGSGGHPGVDIVSVKGTPIYAMYDGEVWFAGRKWGYGNTVTIKHTLPDGETVFSSYSHLDTYTVQIGDSVVSGKEIGTMGNSGNVQGKYGNHVEFQISRANAPAHPYGYHDCQAGYTSAVNDGACDDLMKKYTIDPLEFLNEYGGYDMSGLLEKTHSSADDVEKPNTEKETPQDEGLISLDGIKVVPNDNQNDDQDSNKDNQQDSNNAQDNAQNDEKNNEQDSEQDENPQNDQQENQQNDQQDEYTVVSDNSLATLLASIRERRTRRTSTTNSNETVIVTQEAGELNHTPQEQQEDGNDDLDIPYTITRDDENTNLTVGKLNRIRFSIKDDLNNPFTGRLSEKITIEQSNDNLTLAPSRFSRIVNGDKSVFITPEKPGETTLTVLYDQEEVGTITFQISK